MENIARDPYFEKFINLTVDFITAQVKDKIKEFNLNDNDILVLTPVEAAKQIGVSKTVMYNDLLKRDDFPSYRINTSWFVSRKGLQSWIDEQINQK
ncbi:helix-turn-helix domain-containing protein [Clostridium butyricum]|uniref:helix-turn-helix domain-containing protein n=1 Tax=Clostridium butyricum TaxID=1492 RepID=UPI0034653143